MSFSYFTDEIASASRSTAIGARMVAQERACKQTEASA